MRRCAAVWGGRHGRTGHRNVRRRRRGKLVVGARRKRRGI
jgi:hypothetical protein